MTLKTAPNFKKNIYIIIFVAYFYFEEIWKIKSNPQFISVIRAYVTFSGKEMNRN